MRKDEIAAFFEVVKKNSERAQKCHKFLRRLGGNRQYKPANGRLANHDSSFARGFAAERDGAVIIAPMVAQSVVDRASSDGSEERAIRRYAGRSRLLRVAGGDRMAVILTAVLAGAGTALGVALTGLGGAVLGARLACASTAQSIGPGGDTDGERPRQPLACRKDRSRESRRRPAPPAHRRRLL